jgi:hypothetical protein
MMQSPRRRWMSGGAGPVPVRCRAPTSDSGPKFASPAPPSSSPVELHPSPVELLFHLQPHASLRGPGRKRHAS